MPFSKLFRGKGIDTRTPLQVFLREQHEAKHLMWGHKGNDKKIREDLGKTEKTYNFLLNLMRGVMTRRIFEGFRRI